MSVSSGIYLLLTDCLQIEVDFEYRYPKRDVSLFVKFPQFFEKANDAFTDVKVFQDLKTVLNNTTKEG